MVSIVTLVAVVKSSDGVEVDDLFELAVVVAVHGLREIEVLVLLARWD